MKWVDRMRIPPKVEKHSLDLDWPDTALGKRAPEPPSPGARSEGNVQRDIHHPPGPYIDFQLSDQVPKTDFEGAVLRHFEVLDATRIDHDD